MRLHRRAGSKTPSKTTGEILPKKVAIRAVLVASLIGSTSGVSLGQSDRDRGAGPASPWSKPFPSDRLASLPAVLKPAVLKPAVSEVAASVPTPLADSPDSQPKKLATVSMLGPVPVDVTKDTAKPAVSSSNGVKSKESVLSADRNTSSGDRLTFPDKRSNQQSSQQSNSIPSRHALTQLSSIDSSVDRNRVPEGGIILERGDREILEERSQALAESALHSTSPRLRIERGLPERELELPGVDSQMVSNLRTSRSIPGQPEIRTLNPIEIGVPSVEAAIEPIIEPIIASADAAELDASIGRNLESAMPPTSLPRVEVRRPGEWTSSAGERLALAQQISEETLASRDQVGISPEPIEPPVGWSSIEVELRRCLENCDQLLRRNAVFSARDEAMQGLRTLVRAVDTHRRQWTCEKALQHAMVALKESGDFEESVLLDANQLAWIINNHKTPTLKDKDISVISPTVAGQHYRAYARQSFLIAIDGHPWGADLLYALGKTYEREAEHNVPRGLILRNQATVCFQAASNIAPDRSQISNQLGFNLLQLDRIDEAYIALKSSLEAQPTANAWRNLAEVYRRRGATESLNYALTQAESLTTTETLAGPRTPEVIEVSAEEFARYSPPPVMVSPMTAGTTVPNSVGSPRNQGMSSGVGSTVTAPNSPVAVSSKGWFPKVFR